MLGSIQAGKNIEKLMLKKLIKDFHQIDLHHNNLEQILTSEVFQTALPNSFKGDPFSHPMCIEYCNKSTGKYLKRDLKSVDF